MGQKLCLFCKAERRRIVVSGTKYLLTAIMLLAAPHNAQAEGDEIDSLMTSAHHRVAVKLIAGSVFGIFGAMLGAGLGNLGENDPSQWIETEYALGTLIGYSTGVSFGISSVDKTDRFLYALAGGWAGFGTAVALTISNEELWPSLLVGHIAGAMIMSEYSRRPPEDSRVSVGLSPMSHGGLSAVAKLRF